MNVLLTCAVRLDPFQWGLVAAVLRQSDYHELADDIAEQVNVEDDDA